MNNKNTNNKIFCNFEGGEVDKIVGEKSDAIGGGEGKKADAIGGRRGEILMQMAGEKGEI